MAIFTAIGTAIATALFVDASATFITLAGAVIGTALAVGASALISNYLGRTKKRTYSANQGETQYGGDVPVGALFGTGLVKGQRVFYAKWGSGNKYNAEVFVLSNGWCDGLESTCFFFGEEQTLVSRTIIDNEVAHYGVDGFDDLISIRFYDGRPSQGVDTKLVTDTASLGSIWASTATLDGLCYVVVECEYDAGKFSSGRPSIEFILRGLREYDPRLDDTVSGGSGSHRIDDSSTWEHTLNPALHRLNFQVGLKGLLSGRTILGEGKTLGQLDLSTYFAAMNICDTDMDGHGVYECSLYVSAEDDHTEVLREFDDAMAGYGLNRRGLSGVIAGAPQTSVLTLTDEDIDAERDLEVQYRRSAFDLFNYISGQFTSPDSQYQAESLAPVTVSADVSSDGRIRQTANDFLQVTNADIAQRLLTIRYRQNRYGGSATVPVSRRVGLKVLEGEWITWESLTWLVTKVSYDEEFRFSLELAQTSADVYDEEGIDAGPVIVAPSAPINPSLLSNVAGFAVAVGYLSGADGQQVPSLVFTWTPPADPSITQVIITYRINGTTAEIVTACDAPESGRHEVHGVASGKQWDAKCTIRCVPDRLKTETSWITTTEVTPDWQLILADFAADFQGALESLRTDLSSALEAIQQLGHDSATDGATSYVFREILRQTFLGNLAAIVTTKELWADADHAMAKAVQAVVARSGEATATGLFKIEAVAAPAGVSVRLALYGRIDTASDYEEAGIYIDLTEESGGSISSKIVLDADKVFVASGSDSNAPFTFIDNELVFSGVIRSADGKRRIDASGDTFIYLET